MTQGVQYVVSLQDLNVSSQLLSLEGKAMRLDGSIQGINNSLRGLGFGFGLYEVGKWAKDWVEGAADFETSMVRIKNASQNASDGIKNQFFINDEVDKFKLKLGESADAYGQFLFKIKNAGLGSDVTRKLYDNILEVSTVAAIPSNEMAATVRNVGIMLGEGILEARHLRLLSYVHPQLVPFLAHAIGLKDNQKDSFAKILKEKTDDQTAMQKLSLLMSGGKLTKMAIDSKIILQAFEDYKKSVEHLLPDSLNTLNHAIDEIDTAWQRFRNDTILQLKPEIIAFIGVMKDWAGWLRLHKQSVIDFADALLKLTELWVAYKAIVIANRLLAPLWLTETAAQTTAYGTQVIAVNSLVAAIERLNFVQNAQNGTFLATASGKIMLNTTGNRYAVTAAEGFAGGAASGGGQAVAASGGLLSGLSFVQGALVVGLAAWSVSAITTDLYDLFKGINDPKYGAGGYDGKNLGGGFAEINGLTYKKDVLGYYRLTNDDPTKDTSDNAYLLAHYKEWKNSKDPFIHEQYLAGLELDKKNKAANAGANRIVPETDKIRGQQIVTYNILTGHGAKIVGVEKMENNVHSLNDIDEKEFAHRVAETITAVINDSQIGH